MGMQTQREPGGSPLPAQGNASGALPASLASEQDPRDGDGQAPRAFGEKSPMASFGDALHKGHGSLDGSEECPSKCPDNEGAKRPSSLYTEGSYAFGNEVDLPEELKHGGGPSPRQKAETDGPVGVQEGGTLNPRGSLSLDLNCLGHRSHHDSSPKTWNSGSLVHAGTKGQQEGSMSPFSSHSPASQGDGSALTPRFNQLHAQLPVASLRPPNLPAGPPVSSAAPTASSGRRTRRGSRNASSTAPGDGGTSSGGTTPRSGGTTPELSPSASPTITPGLASDFAIPNCSGSDALPGAVLQQEQRRQPRGHQPMPVPDLSEDLGLLGQSPSQSWTPSPIGSVASGSDSEPVIGPTAAAGARACVSTPPGVALSPNDKSRGSTDQGGLQRIEAQARLLGSVECSSSRAALPAISPALQPGSQISTPAGSEAQRLTETHGSGALLDSGLGVALHPSTSEEKWQRRRHRRRSFESQRPGQDPPSMSALQPQLQPRPDALANAESLDAVLRQSPGHGRGFRRGRRSLDESHSRPEPLGFSLSAVPRSNSRDEPSVDTPNAPQYSLNAVPPGTSRNRLSADFPEPTTYSLNALAQKSGCGRLSSDFLVSPGYSLNVAPRNRSRDRLSADFHIAAARARAAKGSQKERHGHPGVMSFGRPGSTRSGMPHAHGDGESDRPGLGDVIAKQDNSSSAVGGWEEDIAVPGGGRAMSPRAAFRHRQQQQEAKQAQQDLHLAELKMMGSSALDRVLDRLDEQYSPQGPKEPLPNDPRPEPTTEESPGKLESRREPSAMSLRVHVLTGGAAKRSIAPHAFITTQGVSSMRVHVGAESSVESASASLAKARASAEELNFVRRLQKARERAQRTKKAIDSRSGAHQPAAGIGAALGTDRSGVPLAEPAQASEDMASVGGLQQNKDQGQQYIISRHELMLKGSLQPDAKQQGEARVGEMVRRVNGAGGEGLVRQGSMESGSLVSSTGSSNSSRRTSSIVIEKAGLRRQAMSFFAPSQSRKSFEKSISEIAREDAKAEKIREAMSKLKPHQLCILGKPYKDVREYYALHNKKLGAGRYGVIRRCKDVRTGKVYACKTIHKKKVLGAEEAEGIRAEVAALAMLKGHPSVISMKGAFEDHQGVHIVMGFCTGGDLFDRIQAKGALAEPDAARMLAALIAALNHCHSLGIIHRDVKPENVLLASSEVDFDVKLIDFGVSIFFQPGKSLHGIAGTPEYMAPEVLQKRYGPEVDIWSAGVLLYVTLSGLQPFWASSKHGLMTSVLQDKPSFKSPRWTNVSEEAMDLVMRMLDKNPKTRITGEQILDHPWLRKHVNEKVLSD